MTDDTATLTIKVGDKEVRFEAGLEVVRAELARHAAELLRGAEGERAELSVATAIPAAATVRPLGAQTPPIPARRPAGVTLDPARTAALYAVNTAGQLSLETLPEDVADVDAEALMLLLYGMLVFKGLVPVTAPALLRAARQSGLRLQRAHRPLARHTKLVSSSGYRRGKRYRLTAAGIEHCEKRIPDLLERLGG